MRLWLLMSMLLLSFLIRETQGIRLRRGHMLERAHDIHDIIPGMKKTDGIEEGILSRGKHFSGRIRKLMMTPISSNTMSKNDKNEENNAHHKMEDSSANKKIGRKEENLSVNSSSETDQRQPAPEPYPDVLDIAGMDYSQARRKPPIHN